MLDRLVRWAVLAQADGVVREDIDGVPAHEGREADGVARVIRKDEEGATVGD